MVLFLSFKCQKIIYSYLLRTPDQCLNSIIFLEIKLFCHLLFYFFLFLMDWIKSWNISRSYKKLSSFRGYIKKTILYPLWTIIVLRWLGQRKKLLCANKKGLTREKYVLLINIMGYAFALHFFQYCYHKTGCSLPVIVVRARYTGWL